MSESGGRVNDDYSESHLMAKKRLVPLESLPDIQMERAEIDVSAGVCNFSTLFHGNRWTLPVKLSIIVPTMKSRGVHMSRLISAAQKRMRGEYIEDALKDICNEINKSQPGCQITVELEYPVKDQFISVKIMADLNGSIFYSFEKIGITACPCSKQIVGIGHMQRSKLKLEISSNTTIDFEEVDLKLGECFSAEPVEFLKRSDEGEKILEAQSNPKFVEDLVRDCLKRFPDAVMIEATSSESIHSHDAIAFWKKQDYQQTI